jgi:opacity protein-like surface antigen
MQPKYMTKKILILILFPLLFASNLLAQRDLDNIPNFDEQRWHWGYFLGVNHYDFSIVPTDAGMTDNNQLGVNTETTIGFSVGLIGDLKLNDYFNLRFEPGLDIAKRELVYRRELLEQYPNIGDPDYLNDTIRNINSTYINLPLLLKFGGKRRHNIRPYAIGGMNLGIDLTSNEDSSNDNFNGIDGFRMTKMNYSWQAGAGIDWYLPFFKLSTEIRGSFGINDEMVLDGNPPGSIDSPWTSTIEELHTRAIFFVLKFE